MKVLTGLSQSFCISLRPISLRKLTCRRIIFLTKSCRRYITRTDKPYCRSIWRNQYSTSQHYWICFWQRKCNGRCSWWFSGVTKKDLTCQRYVDASVTPLLCGCCRNRNISFASYYIFPWYLQLCRSQPKEDQKIWRLPGICKWRKLIKTIQTQLKIVE